MTGGKYILLNTEPTVIECETLRGFHPSAAGLSPAPGNESKNPRGASFSLGRNTGQPCQRPGVAASFGFAQDRLCTPVLTPPAVGGRGHSRGRAVS